MDQKRLEEKLTLLDQLQSACTHCGLCSEACATFQSTGWEHESPRGRLHLASQFLHGHIQLQSDALSTFDHCLGCQACESLCPHQVSYHQVRQLVQEIRSDLQLASPAAVESSRYQYWITMAHRISNRWWRHYGARWLNISSLHYQNEGSFTRKSKRIQSNKPVLAICCIQDLFQHQAIEQTLAFVERLGESLQVDRNQPCCGAIFERLVHGGEEVICYPEKQKKVARLQIKTRNAFLKWMPNRLYFLSRGCQSFISQKNDQAEDLYAWIENVLTQKGITLHFPQPRVVYYQPYCRSQKGEQDSIWRLLKRIQGLTVREIEHPKACCGGFCGEVLLHSEHARTLINQKMSYLSMHSTLVVTSPDCWGGFKNHEQSQHVTICYPIQILMEAQILKS
jgi:glycolate oxidase iron-sulfur subunit